MPATQFICPDGGTIQMDDCLENCRMGERCMFLPTIRAAAKSTRRNLTRTSVTELMTGTREAYLKKIAPYAVEPQSVLFALHGQAVHLINEGHTEGNMLSEIRLYDDNTTGQFDLYGRILDNVDDGVLGDFKVTSSYKLMRALGYYKADVPTGEVYKTGIKKGQPKYRKELRTDGVRHLMDWALQLNMYRMMLEKQGFTVSKMVIQAMCRDYSPRTALERGITENIYLIPIRKISDHWIDLYFKTKAARLQNALQKKNLPPVCTAKERWNDLKCQKYCTVAKFCPYAASIALKEKADAI